MTMAMSLFSYFKGKRDIKHSKFNMSFQNLHTANFGSLNPVACYEVLAGDKWKVSQNTLTKVQPMPAPAFSRIKQNFYSFFVPNQVVWKHWNDFITNGTAYLDTYGNNQTNQEITNQWQQPSVMVPDLQLHTKLANGWALPCFRLTTSQLLSFLNKIPPAYSNDNGDAYTPGSVKLAFYTNETGTVPSDSDLEKILWVQYCCDSGFSKTRPTFWQNIPYVHPMWNISRTTSTVQGVSYTLITATITAFEFCSDFHTAVLFENWLDGTIFNDSGSDEKNKDDTSMTKGSSGKTTLSTSTVFPTVSSAESYLGKFWISMRYFADCVSDDLRLDHSPFKLTKTSFTPISRYTTNTLNTFVATENLYNLQKVSYDVPYTFYDNSGNTVVSRKVVIPVESEVAGFYGHSFGSLVVKNSAGNDVTIYYINGVVYGGVVTGFTVNNVAESLGDVPFVFAYHLPWLLCHCIDVGGVSFSFSTLISNDLTSYGHNLFKLRFRISDTQHSFYHSSSSFSLIGGSSNDCDVAFPIRWRRFSSINLTNFDNHTFYALPSVDLFDSEAYSLGYDSFGFMVYNSQKVSKSLDYFNIPQEGFTARRWCEYAGELINVLPWFGMSKIWNDYFRNKTTSSAELCFKETNGVAFLDSDRFSYLQLSSVYISRVNPCPLLQSCIDSYQRNSWVIPMSTAPKSGIGRYTDEAVSNKHFINITKNEFHYFNIDSYLDLFSLLSGWSLTDTVIDKILNYVVIEDGSSTDIGYVRLRGLLLDNIYLPNYYNGLMRLKYQNFSKDYFSSAMLDPMHGANDVMIGDTISDLRSEIVQQNFWEEFAMARSIKHAFQSLMGTTPTHIEQDKPLLLGIDHMPVNIGEIIQTSQTTDTSPQGQRSGLAAASGHAGLCSHYFNEGGYLIVLSSFTVEQQYFQGLEHQFSPYESFLDYPWIQLAHIGNESILMRELKWISPATYNFDNVISGRLLPNYRVEGSKVLMDGRTSPLFINSASRTVVETFANVVDSPNTSKGFGEIFGYIPRNSNYKFKLDQVHGAFRSQMDYWQSFRKFYKKPMLTHEFVNWEFVADDGDLNRLFVVEDENISDKFYVDCFINALVSRALPVVNVPATK